MVTLSSYSALSTIPVTPDEIRATNKLDTLLDAAVQARPVPFEPKVGEDLNVIRKHRAAHLQSLRHLMPIPGPIPDEVAEDELFVEASDGYQIRTHVYRPAKACDKDRPLVVLFHEGGWFSGDLSDEDCNARLLVKELGVVCLNVEYRLAPEHPFPTGANDCWTVLQWAAKNPSAVSANPTKGFIVGGSSAGGNLSAVLAHLSVTENLQPPVTGQWLSVPYLIPSQQLPPQYKDVFLSPFENCNDPVLKQMDDTKLNILAKMIVKADLDSPLWSPIAPSLYPPPVNGASAPGRLAKAYFQVAGMDPMRDHGLVYDRILREEYGVETRMDLYAGVGHMFWTNWPELEISKRFAKDMVEGFKWLLGKQ